MGNLMSTPEYRTHPAATRRHKTGTEFLRAIAKSAAAVKSLQEDDWPFWPGSDEREGLCDYLAADPGELEGRPLAPDQRRMVCFDDMPEGLRERAREHAKSGGDILPPHPNAPGVLTDVVKLYGEQLMHGGDAVLDTLNGKEPAIRMLRAPLE